MKKFLALLVALVAILVLPVGVALADGNRPGGSERVALRDSIRAGSFTAQVTLVQDPAAGSIAYLCKGGGSLPYPCEVAGRTTVGAKQTGEVFNGVFSSCSGQQCALVLGSAIAVTQNSTVFFTGLGPNPGDVKFVGTVNGKFVISKSGDALDGGYAGVVSGIINFGTHTISGAQTSAWRATDASGAFEVLERSAGVIKAPIAGFFPGYEVATATVTGVFRAD